MKTLPFLFILFVFTIVATFIILLPRYTITHAFQNTFTVTAYVQEHLTFIKNNQGLIVSTNLPGNFIILSDSSTQKFKLSGPAETNISDISSFILVAEF